MSGTKKTVLLILGALSAVLILSQLVMGQLIVSGRTNLIKSHQHTGYLAVVVALIYVVASLVTLVSIPTTPEKP